MSRLFHVIVFAAIAVLPSQGSAEPASPWTEGFHSRIRLVSGGIQDGRRLAGIEIVLDRGFKTYWRNPGESGLPPRFDWASSANAAAIDLQWPAPARSEDAGGTAHTYADRVVFPVLVRPQDPTKPTELKLAIDYGVCKDICIPAHAEIALTLSDAGAHGAAVQAALDRVPRPAALGSPGALSILAVEPVVGDKPTFAVRVRAPAGAAPVLFAEGPDNWYLSTSATLEQRAGEDGRFLLSVDERPKDAASAIPVRLTLVTEGQAIETDIRLDAAAAPR